MNKIISKSFLWMFVGLLVTFVTALYVSTNERMLISIFSTNLFYAIIIAELIIVIVLSARVYKMSANKARAWFILYAFVSGLTFSSIFVAYQVASLIFVFLASAIIFLLFGLIGYATKIDLTKMGSILMMGLLGAIICSVINIFIGSSTFDLVLSIVCLIIFLGITAYDLQRIKRLSAMDINEDSIAIIGALSLYLDFINIFLRLLSLFGKSKN